MSDYVEIKLARALGRAIEIELSKGNLLPSEVLMAYEELLYYWQQQIEDEKNKW